MASELHVVIGATLYQATQWAIKNGVSAESLWSMDQKGDGDRLMGIRGATVVFVGRDLWWMSPAAGEALSVMQRLTEAGETVRFVSDDEGN